MRSMSNSSRRHLAALPWRRWRLSRPAPSLPRRGCSVRCTSSSGESLVGQLEPNDATAGSLLDRGQAAPFSPLGLAAGESQTVLWLLAEQPRELSASFGGPVPRSPSQMCRRPALPTQQALEEGSSGQARCCAPPSASLVRPSRPSQQPRQENPATPLRVGEEMMR